MTLNYNIIIHATRDMGQIIVRLPKEWQHKNITPSASGESWLVNKVGGNVLYAPTDTFKRVLEETKLSGVQRKKLNNVCLELIIMI